MMKIESDFKTRGYIGISIASIFIFLVVPLLTTNYYAHLLLQGCFTAIILSTVYTISNRKSILIAGTVLIALFLFIDTLSFLNDSIKLMVIAYGFYTIFLLFAIVLLVNKVLTSPVIDTNLIFGAITVFLFSGILWSKLYLLVYYFLPDSFHGIQNFNLSASNLGDGYEIQFNLLYYSFTILATLGMGDITPIHHLAKSLTILEAAFGQLFVATVIAKVVSIWHNNK